MSESGAIDLDHNATTRPHPSVIRAVTEAMESAYANPSSVHRGGQAARRVVELARGELAGLIGVKPRDLILTSSGTESIDLAIRGTLLGRPGSGPGAMAPVLVTTAIEHAAVRDLGTALEREGSARVVRASISTGSERGGVVDVASVEALARGAVENRARAVLVSVQWANNETGTIQPVEEIHRVCRALGVPFHCDGTQWVGKMPVEAEPPCDLLTYSPHKFHGPKGVGCLWARRGVGLRPTLHGSQEQGRRGGTENVPGIAGAGAAAAEARAWLAGDHGAAERARLGGLRDELERLVLAACPGAVVNGSQTPRLWNTTNIGFPRLEAEGLLVLLSEAGVYASAGAACSSGSLDPSPVLLAMGVASAVAHGSIRLSLGRETTAERVRAAAEIIAASVARLGRSMG